MDTHVIATVRDRDFGSEGMSLLRLGGLKVGRVPRWFRKIVNEEFGGLFNAEWFDHPSQSGDALVVEPYSLGNKAILDLMAFAEKFDLNISISGMSFHYPTRTVSVFLMQKTSGVY